MFKNGPSLSFSLHFLTIVVTVFLFPSECSKELSRFLKLMNFNEADPDKPVKWNRTYDVIFHCAPFMNAEVIFERCRRSNLLSFLLAGPPPLDW